MNSSTGDDAEAERSLGQRIRGLRALLRSTKTDTSWSSLSDLAGRERLLLLAIAALALLTGFAETLILVLLANLAGAMAAGDSRVDLSIGPLDATTLRIGTVLALAAGLAIVRLGLRLTASLASARLATRVFEELRNEMVETYLAASWQAQHGGRSGHLQDVLSSFLNRSVGALTSLSRTISSLGTFVILVVSAFLLDARFAAAVVLAIAFFFLLLRPFTRLVRFFQRRAAKTSLRWVNYLAQITGQTREINVYGVGEPVAARAAKINSELRRDRFRARAAGALVPDMYQTAATLAVVTGLAIVYAIGDSNFASMAAVILLFLRASSYATQLLTQYQGLQAAVPFIDMFRDAEATLRESAPTFGHRPLEHIETVEFRDVSFSYGDGRPAVRDVSFSVERGEMIGIVGPSGAGKSTLVQLLLRLRKVDAGQYLVNGHPSHDFEPRAWAGHIAFVPQEPQLFATTITGNIAFFRPGIADEAIQDAARRAHLVDDLGQLPDGLDTWVGDEGRMISGGQRQRVAIARALAGRPDLIIMDEPTSALDLHSEAAIQAALAEARGSTTLFVVAHRLSTLNDCDRIMVLDGGHLSAFEKPTELAGQSDFYHRALELATTPGGPAAAS